MKLKKTINKLIFSIKSASLKKRRLAIVLITIILICSVIFALFAFRDKDQADKENEPNPKNSLIVERTAPGGDPKLVISYHEQSIAAWKAGDKEKAKELAKKGLDLNNNLTNEQLTQIPSQSSVMFDLYDLSEGSYEEN